MSVSSQPFIISPPLLRLSHFHFHLKLIARNRFGNCKERRVLVKDATPRSSVYFRRSLSLCFIFIIFLLITMPLILLPVLLIPFMSREMSSYKLIKCKTNAISLMILEDRQRNEMEARGGWGGNSLDAL
jgi:hypothetical protein